MNTIEMTPPPSSLDMDEYVGPDWEQRRIKGTRRRWYNIRTGKWDRWCRRYARDAFGNRAAHDAYMRRDTRDLAILLGYKPRAELMELVKSHGIRGCSKATKPELAAILAKHLSVKTVCCTPKV